MEIDADHGRDLERAAEQVGFVLAEQVIGADTHNEERPGGEASQDGVRELGRQRWIEQQIQEIIHLKPPVAHHVADRLLHERVGNQDPQGGDVGTDGHQPDGGGVHALGELVPAEDPQAQEGGFEEERQQGFDRQRGAEDIAHKARVLRPVHAELELLDDAGDHPHGKVDDKQLAPELGHALVDFLTGAHVEGLHQRHQDG